ncbi:MAG: trimethylamine methyltransferase family protein, partial [Anaerolineales bacterium]|nr:trimethylamine methyltransferase family protein [Anaerolineales bacterium]
MTERRSTRRGQRAESPLLKLPFRQLRNPLKPLEILTPEQVEKVHEASMRILEETGLLMMDAEALSLWQAAGAQVDHKAQHVRLARDPAKSVTVGENYITFAPQGGVAYATDLDYGRRRGSLRDYQNFLKLIQMSGPLHYAGEQVMALYDVENSLRHLTRLSNAITLTDKALMEAAHGRVVTEDSLHLARLVFGDIEAG